jgi:hypothetical protein
MTTSSNNTVYGECGKHPGENMVNCSQCEMETPQPKIKFKKGSMKAIRKAFKRLKDNEEQ